MNQTAAPSRTGGARSIGIVQLALERFLPELRDLEQKKDEISDIVAKRRGFELSLAQGRGTKPSDYLRYIDYERKLERLRKARAARIATASKKSLSDHSIPAHITQLHRLAVRRFPESIALWDASIAHALTQSSPFLVSRILTAAIAMHLTHTPYWELIWREWIHVEDAFIERLRERWAVLSISKGESEEIIRVKGKGDAAAADEDVDADEIQLPGGGDEEDAA
ncbi:U3 snoRNP protein [Rhodotorula kratochvilovae]